MISFPITSFVFLPQQLQPLIRILSHCTLFSQVQLPFAYIFHQYFPFYFPFYFINFSKLLKLNLRKYQIFILKLSNIFIKSIISMHQMATSAPLYFLLCSCSSIVSSILSAVVTHQTSQAILFAMKFLSHFRNFSNKHNFK